MLKNKEVKWLIMITLLLACLTVFVWSKYPENLIAVLIFDLLVLTAFYYGSMLYRLFKIKKLTAYLYRLSEGQQPLLLDEYKEGELSLLQSEIYKLAVRLTEQAELLNQDKLYLANAISDISHQLKTPVTSMRVMADLLGSSSLPEDRRRVFTGNIQSQINRMEYLVSALLKMAKIDAKAVVLKKDSFSIEQLINLATEHLLIPMELKNIEFLADGDLNALVVGDKVWLSEALANIIKNCIEHTPEGGHIHVLAEYTPIYIRIEISDSGCGVCDEDLPHIFERFYKGKNASPDSVGIGLAMAKQIILEMNGSLAVTKTGHEGTTFTIKIYKK